MNRGAGRLSVVAEPQLTRMLDQSAANHETPFKKTQPDCGGGYRHALPPSRKPFIFLGVLNGE